MRSRPSIPSIRRTKTKSALSKAREGDNSDNMLPEFRRTVSKAKPRGKSKGLVVRRTQWGEPIADWDLHVDSYSSSRVRGLLSRVPSGYVVKKKFQWVVRNLVSRFQSKEDVLADEGSGERLIVYIHQCAPHLLFFGGPLDPKNSAITFTAHLSAIFSWTPSRCSNVQYSKSRMSLPTMEKKWYSRTTT